LIFVIVIIGILAAVAIPKMAATRSDATATTCVHEIGGLVSTASAMYTKIGETRFEKVKASALYNGNVPTTTGNGIRTNVALGGAGITYLCDGQDVVTIKFIKSTATTGAKFNITPKIAYDPTNAAGKQPENLGQIITDKLAGGLLTAKDLKL